MTDQEHSAKAKLPGPAYLGDGVYASFDGYHIWLAVNDHENNVVALEGEVYQSLVLYADKVFRRPKEGL